ncbi:DUF5301 domain-containing protein [Paenibacillus sp. ACRSA]|uniref:DUF5301 domain-containing protein n=1 Tax=Paenibacillus sp. ACRSA TaxID=2918211 RepID=UPI001EF5CC13|nr:DUF5301 domain-containing protein [Paenibacillus sp. ACRSA]MCG7379342.1 DUF5301 domain-containing protein [Paenibacillus sp. ACRSA]
MQKRSYYILALIIILLAIGIWFYTANRTTSLEDAAWKGVNSDTITSIDIEKGQENKVTLTDKEEIEKIMSSLSDIDVKETSTISKDISETYTVFVFVADKRKLGMFLYDNKYVEVYDYEATPKKNSSMKYEISNNYDMKVIQDYFE